MTAISSENENYLAIDIDEQTPSNRNLSTSLVKSWSLISNDEKNRIGAFSCCACIISLALTIFGSVQLAYGVKCKDHPKWTCGNEIPIGAICLVIAALCCCSPAGCFACHYYKI